MTEKFHEFPSHEEGLALHLHLSDLNPVAVADVCQAYVNPLIHWIAVKFAGVDSHLQITAVHEALMSYVQKPGAYDPKRGDLAKYLRMAARGDLINLLKRESRHHQGRVNWAVVEDVAEDGNISGADDPSVQVSQAEERQQWRTFLETVVATFSEEEHRVFDLMLAGERDAEVFAEALDDKAVPPAEQEREIKKVKDRIKKRLQRGVVRHA
jgi:hypothetical protein